MALVALFYELIFGFLNISTFIGVEPLGFGLACLIVDMALIGIKDLIVFLVKRAVKNPEKRRRLWPTARSHNFWRLICCNAFLQISSLKKTAFLS